MPSTDVGQWIREQVDQAPQLSEAAARRISAALFGGGDPPVSAAHEGPIPAANPVSGSHLPHMDLPPITSVGRNGVAQASGGFTSAEIVSQSRLSAGGAV